jgi:hypothetical protein
MKQCKFILLTLVIVAFTGAALTHAGGAHNRLPDSVARGTSPLAGRSRSPFADAALQRWRLGGATHWRSMLLQR